MAEKEKPKEEKKKDLEKKDKEEKKEEVKNLPEKKQKVLGVDHEAEKSWAMWIESQREEKKKPVLETRLDFGRIEDLEVDIKKETGTKKAQHKDYDSSKKYNEIKYDHVEGDYETSMTQEEALVGKRNLDSSKKN